MSGGRGLCSFLSLSKHLHTPVKKSNFSLLSICSVWLLVRRLGKHLLIIRPYEYNIGTHTNGKKFRKNCFPYIVRKLRPYE